MSGLLLVVPIYLTGLLLAKGFETAVEVVKPIKGVLPQWFPGEEVMSVALILIICLLLGLALRTSLGQWLRDWIENTFLNRIPGYTQIRDLSRQVAGDPHQKAWKPALVQFEDGLVHAFLVEECNDELVTVFVPDIPSVLTGDVFIVKRERVHLLDVPFATAFKSLSNWGAGSKDLIASLPPESLRD
ncbi:MAG: DUF502 domain-containing protein [Pirellula sp.]|jgi:uncharacterized membrane protein|nr:DUF502 domain-containing protein [Pirellula sp.]